MTPIRTLVAELVGTAFLVIFAVGTATLSFGFGFADASRDAGVLVTAFAFGLVLLALVYAIGPISGCHVNPAVTMGFMVSGRMRVAEGLRYWAAQVVGAILGALVLWGIFSGAQGYSRHNQGLGADGFGSASMVHLNAAGAVAAETVLTLLFVFVVLSATSKLASPGFAGLAIGLALTTVHIIGIPLTGTSVNPARSIGPALIVGGLALSQLWLFILAPLLGGLLAALLYRYLLMPSELDVDASATTQAQSLAQAVLAAGSEAGEARLVSSIAVLATDAPTTDPPSVSTGALPATGAATPPPRPAPGRRSQVPKGTNRAPEDGPG